MYVFKKSWIEAVRGRGVVDVSRCAAVYQAQYEPLNVRHKVPLFAKINYC